MFLGDVSFALRAWTIASKMGGAERENRGREERHRGAGGEDHEIWKEVKRKKTPLAPFPLNFFYCVSFHRFQFLGGQIRFINRVTPGGVPYCPPPRPRERRTSPTRDAVDREVAARRRSRESWTDRTQKNRQTTSLPNTQFIKELKKALVHPMKTKLPAVSS